MYTTVIMKKKKRIQKIKHTGITTSTTNQNISTTSLRVLVIQDGDYIKFPKFSSYTTAINTAYCRKWGYNYKFKEHKNSNIPPYWLKVLDVQEALKSNQYDIVVYVDLDACFLDFNMSLETVINRIDTDSGRISDMYFGEDSADETLANTGVFLVRNTPLGVILMDTWKSMCINDKGERQNACSAWDKVKSKWTCKHCEWAGREYEQGTMNNLVDLFPDNIAVVDRSFFSSATRSNKPYMIHAMGTTPEIRLKTFKEIYEELRTEFKTEFKTLNKG